MPDLPEHPTCVVRDGERVTIKRHHILMPDGSRRVDLTGCELQSGSVLVIEYRQGHGRRHKHVVTIPADPSPTEVAPSLDATSVVAVVPASIDTTVASHGNVDPLVVALAVGGVGVAGAVGWRAMRGAGGSGRPQINAQQQEQERQRAECATKSDSVLLDFRAHAADFKTRNVASINEPIELWKRADMLDAQLAELQLAMRALAKTRRA